MARAPDDGGVSGRQIVGLVGGGLLLALVLLEIGLRGGGALFLWLQERRNQASLQKDHPLVVLCIGESTTAMGGRDSYPSQLDRTLNLMTGGLVVSVVNKGVPATNTNVIVEKVPGYLAEYHPDVVVAMMGINDPRTETAPADEPSRLERWLGSLRVVEFGKFAFGLVETWWRGEDPAPAVGPPDPEAIERRLLAGLAADPSDGAALTDLAALYVAQGRLDDAKPILLRAVASAPGDEAVHALVLAWEKRGRDGEGTPAVESGDGAGLAGEEKVEHDVMHLFESGKASRTIVRVIGDSPRPGAIRAVVGWAYWQEADRAARAGHPDEADRLMQRIRRGHRGAVDDSYYGELARLAHAKRDYDGFERNLALAESLRPPAGNPVTARNYRTLRALLRQQRVQLVAVQYPLRKADVLRRMLGADDGIVFVDNEFVFKQVLRNAPYERFFTDAFAGDFGHMTREGNHLLAVNVATAIMARLRESGALTQPPAKGASR